MNLNHCEAAQDLLIQGVKEENIDVSIISEPYRVPGNSIWIMNGSHTSAIWICGFLPFQQTYALDIGFVMAGIKGVFVLSCYASPRWSMDEIQHILERLASHMRLNNSVIIAGRPNGVVDILAPGVAASWKRSLSFLLR